MKDNTIPVVRFSRTAFDVKTAQRIVEGLAIPYGVAEEVTDDWGLSSYLEEWDQGVFARYTVPANMGRVQLNFMHDDSPSSWVGRTVSLVESSEGLVGRWRVDASPMGDTVLFKLGDGQLPGLSISAIPERSSTIGGVVHREIARLRHVALVDEPAFSGALVSAVRKRHAARLFDRRAAVELAAAKLPTAASLRG